MTEHIKIPDVTPIARYLADGVQTVFSYPFPIFASEDLTVSLNGAAQIALSGYAGKTFPGRIVWIADKAEFTPKNVQTREARSDLVYAVKVAVDNPDGILKIGMPADVTLL